MEEIKGVGKIPWFVVRFKKEFNVLKGNIYSVRIIDIVACGFGI